MSKKVVDFFKSIGLENNEMKNIRSHIGGVSLMVNTILSIEDLLNTDSGVIDEVEKKILEINRGDLMGKLKRLGAKEVFTGIIKDNRYDFPNLGLRKRGIILRIRETCIGNFITLKQQQKDETGCSIDHEFEKKIKDIKELKKILESLGLKEIKGKRYKKQRISYELNGVHFDFDKYYKIPWLLEVEANTEKKVNKWIEKLGLANYNSVKYGYRKLKEYYNV